MIYGHFTLSEFKQRNGNLFLEHNGRWYRITETHVIRALDRVNYQAEECDAREVQAWLAEKVVESESEQALVVATVSSPDTGEDAGGEPDTLSSTTLSAEPEQTEPETSADFESFLDELEENYPATMGVAPQFPPEESDEWAPVATETEHHEVPSLSAWAKEHGWAGVGRISKKLREAYKAEFGAEG